ncbi:nitroreductase family protein [Bacillus changyiensis]|uniref:nitroreductase family protein n=1 Tax=Bacillus changyiensis TaxID=3004103 RepID=UPI0022DEDA81|nr:nitroreductase [Bacillus changyiensis]MDA1478331.1 nitroreductase [Bacillus changyiensis]
MNDTLSSIQECIRDRRTIRKFREEPVPKELILELLEDAVYAPNHRLTEPWRFIYIGTESGKKKFVESMTVLYNDIKPDMKEEQLQKYKEYFMKIPAFLFVVLKEDENKRVRNDDFAAVSCLIQNLQLLAWDKGIGMVWKSGELLYNRGFAQSFGLKDHERFAAVLQLGYPAEIPKAETRTPAEQLFIEIS